MKQEHSCCVYLIRHGEVANVQDGPRLNGHFDVELSQRGVDQIRQVSSMLKGLRLSAVYSSDLRRTHVSACIVAEPHGHEPVTFPELREISMGNWEGKSIKEIERQFPGELENCLKNIGTFPGGESYGQLRDRVIPKLRALVKKHPGEAIVILAHGGVNIIILSHVLGIPPHNFFTLAQDYAAINIIQFYENTAIVKLINGNSIPNH